MGIPFLILNFSWDFYLEMISYLFFFIFLIIMMDDDFLIKFYPNRLDFFSKQKCYDCDIRSFSWLDWKKCWRPLLSNRLFLILLGLNTLTKDLLFWESKTLGHRTLILSRVDFSSSSFLFLGEVIDFELLFCLKNIGGCYLYFTS